MNLHNGLSAAIRSVAASIPNWHAKPIMNGPDRTFEQGAVNDWSEPKSPNSVVCISVNNIHQADLQKANCAPDKLRFRGGLMGPCVHFPSGAKPNKGLMGRRWQETVWSPPVEGLVQRILVDHAVLHDNLDVVAVCDRIEAFQRVAFDEQEIGQRVHFDTSDNTRIRIAWTG